MFKIEFRTVDPMHEGVHISDGMIGGIVGGLLFLFVAIILAVLAIKIFNKRKQREKAMRYGNVKYFGPKHMDSNKKLVWIIALY
ncbi:hypothetical protein LSH36_202g01004 [Paralvinella palmiformis]|uniref:Uncharacterized protein n=1 Tax=Paralvinella palmiformis TaxID=53620 RepID=A0AAD9N4X1_9ANNE|nr:hypothetical protein LSH36_202g01004 [Paralvinella palmiformis]